MRDPTPGLYLFPYGQNESTGNPNYINTSNYSTIVSIIKNRYPHFAWIMK